MQKKKKKTTIACQITMINNYSQFHYFNLKIEDNYLVLQESQFPNPVKQLDIQI